MCETSQYLALFTDPVTDLAQKVWTLPIFQHFSSDFLSFNMTDLADNETTIYTTSVHFSSALMTQDCHECMYPWIPDQYVVPHAVATVYQCMEGRKEGRNLFI